MNIDWDSITKKTKYFSLENTTHTGKVVSVYDGDTIKVVFPVHDTLYKWSCRLEHVDTPELRTKCKLEKQYGYHVRDELRKKILDKIVTVKCGEFDKYGRLLAEIYTSDDNEDCSVNDWLVEKGYAFYYDGGTKQCWSEFLKENLSILEKC